MEMSESFLQSVIPFKLTFNEAFYLSDNLSLVREVNPIIPRPSGVSFIYESSKPFKPNSIPVSDDLIMKILFIISSFETTIDTHEVEMPFTFRELLEIREAAISTREFRGDNVGKNILSKIAIIVVENSFQRVPDLDESLISEIDEIIEAFEERKEE